MEMRPNLKLLLVIGGCAQRWHFGSAVARQGVDETVRQWRQVYEAAPPLRMFLLPHPSWHNTRWLKCNPWFETDMPPVLRQTYVTCFPELHAGRRTTEATMTNSLAALSSEVLG